LAIFDSTSAVVELADNAISQINGIGLKMAGAFTIAVPPTATKSLEMEVNGTVYTQAYEASATTTMNLLAAQITNDQADIIASADTGITLTLTSLTNDVAWSSSGLKVFNDSEAVVANASFAGTTENAATVKQSGTFTATAAAINQTFKLTVNGTEFSQDFDTDAATTMEKLALQIGNGSSNLVATTSGSTNLLLESTVAGTAFTVGGLVTTQNHGGNASILTAAGAAGAMSSIDASIAQVDSYRSELGAVANRLDHTVSNLMNRVENQSAAKSRIEDTDFAVESANLAKAQVLQQAGTAMLAQANASGQSVLSLLK
jgi:flagellin